MQNIEESIRRATRLLRALRANRAQLPNVQSHRQELTQVLGRLAALRSHRKMLEAEKRAATALIHEELGRLVDLTRLIRTIIQGNLGLRSEKLTLFGIAPLGSRRRRQVKPPAEARKPAA
jgi:hypothetical protein